MKKLREAWTARDTWKVTRDQINIVFSDLKWMIAIALLFALVFFQPEQIRELYRSALADQRLINEVRFFVPFLVIAGIIWFGSLQVLTSSFSRTGDVSPRLDWWLRWLPPLLGGLPLLACAAALYFSVPEPSQDPQLIETYNRSGSPFKDFDLRLAETVGHQLFRHAAFMLGAALVFIGLTRLVEERLRPVSAQANVHYFGNRLFLALTLALIAGLTAAFVKFPVGLPRALGVFGIIAAFVVCVTAFAIHFTLLTIKWRIPFIPLIFVAALAFSYFDFNDNHAIRTINVPGAEPTTTARDARSQFIAWFKNRPDSALYREEYPVYIVAAQGGGIYAAHQTGVFLARMQDVCPTFKNHLFAVSSVSGGSVGAATFASALHAQQAGALGPQPGNGRAQPSASLDPCPKISQFLRPDAVPSNLDAPGPLEQAVQKALSNDFLSPLIAATLFPDFTQRFLPFRVPRFDRARALEYAVETTAASAFGVNGKTLFDQNFGAHWDVKGSLPALVMNTTDVGSGRRVLISPFEIEREKKGEDSIACAIVNLSRAQPSPSAPAGKGAGVAPLQGVRLSTAAVMSARFPWVTPAATVHVQSECLRNQDKVRLVDGGYVDNSGVETALALIDSLKNVDQQLALETEVNPDRPPYPPIRVHLIVLSGGGFPERSSFALGESLEPIRALLSTRESRAYVALDRAKREMPKRTIESQDKLATGFSVELSHLRTASLVNRFYPLPLGWSMSDRTREIIALQSGRFWDCQFDASFTQGPEHLAETDCIQMLTYHELNQSLKTVVGDIAITRHVQNLDIVGSVPEAARVNHERVVACYAEDYNQTTGRTLFNYQAESVRALLRVWDSHRELDDNRWLAYILATAAFETGDFRIMSDLLSIRSAQRIVQTWPARFKDAAEAEPYVNNPEDLANRVYGNRLGNTQPGDGWRYRGRGMVQIVGRENYQRYGALIDLNLEERPELVLNRDVAARVTFAYFIPSPDKNLLSQYLNAAKEDWRGARMLLVRGGAGAEGVAAKAEMFLACINGAPIEGTRRASR